MSHERERLLFRDRIAERLGGYAIGLGVVTATLMVGASFLRW